MNHKAEPSMVCLSDAAPEQILVVAAKNGNGQAFETLFKRHQQKILRIVLRYAHVREDAEDIVQQSFQKAFVYLHKFEGKSSFSTWLTRIAINESLMLLRHSRTQREVPVDNHSEAEGNAASLEMPDSSPDPEASYLRRERAQILAQTLGNLRPGMRKAIELRELAELSTEETARRMGISVGAVKARLFHGRKKLQEKLSRYRKANSTHEKGTKGISNTSGHTPQNHLCDASGF
ncbi:MAG TPA: sigma-70 family RNA polymerase sigma factor [Candidatus Acidoferrum sp.]|nr:sigma-70 family RNA polymerase sigma factor [Candidatus Acidoferrum sp.]